MKRVAVFADESIQDREDLGAKYAHFSGVNLKLMKCGGLDLAKAMADKARQLGLQGHAREYERKARSAARPWRSSRPRPTSWTWTGRGC